MDTYEWVLLIAYFSVVGTLAVYGSHRYQMVFLYYKHKRHEPRPRRQFPDDRLPKVTVQLPVFNEMYVVERLIDTVARLDYPRDRLEIQVLDDSLDETTAIARRKSEEWRAKGLDIHFIHRTNRKGFKAGALEEGLALAAGELVAIFDADFTPEPDMLRKTVHFFTDPQVGLVQTRWGHLNNDFSLLTEVQGIGLDGHLMIEQTARNRSGRFFNFNGTGGIWRRTAIEQGGGWHHDTLTEDLDLSFRAQLKGWKFVFLPHVVSPAELPVDITAYKTQQHRWTKGAVQCARKLLPAIWKSDIPLKCKIEATFQLTMNSAYVLMVLLSILMLPAVTVRFERDWLGYILIDIPFFFAATTSVFTFYVASQREAYPRDWWKRLKYVPFVVSVGIGMCLSNAKAVLEGWFGEEGEFVRTPKHGITSTDAASRSTWQSKKYTGFKSLLPVLELAFGTYFIFVLWTAVQNGRYLTLPFLGLFVFGFFYVAFLSLAHSRDRAVGAGLSGPSAEDDDEETTVPRYVTEKVDIAV